MCCATTRAGSTSAALFPRTLGEVFEKELGLIKKVEHRNKNESQEGIEQSATMVQDDEITNTLNDELI